MQWANTSVMFSNYTNCRHKDFQDQACPTCSWGLGFTTCLQTRWRSQTRLFSGFGMPLVSGSSSAIATVISATRPAKKRNVPNCNAPCSFQEWLCMHFSRVTQKAAVHWHEGMGTSHLEAADDAQERLSNGESSHEVEEHGDRLARQTCLDGVDLIRHLSLVHTALNA